MPNRVSHNHIINVGTAYMGLSTESSSTHILAILSGTSYQLMKHEPIKLLCRHLYIERAYVEKSCFEIMHKNRFLEI